MVILHVEDNPGDVRLAKIAMKKAGFEHEVQVATSGQEALDFLQHEGRHAEAPTPELILLDLNLPGIDGWEVLEEIKQSPSLRHIPVVILTSSSAAHDVKRSYQLHANSYITKPSEIKDYIQIFQGIDRFWFQTSLLPE